MISLALLLQNGTNITLKQQREFVLEEELPVNSNIGGNKSRTKLQFSEDIKFAALQKRKKKVKEMFPLTPGTELSISTRETRQDRNYNSSNPQIKIKINNFIAERSKLIDNAMVLTLDSWDLKTASSAKNAYVLVPNLTPSCFQEMKIQITKKKLQNVHLCLSTLNSILERFPMDTFSVDIAYFDYCATLNGNKKQKVYPKNDIDLYFRKRIAAITSFFILTVCQRQKGGNVKQECKEYVKKIAECHGYNVTVSDEQRYGSAMYYIIFDVQFKQA